MGKAKYSPDKKGYYKTSAWDGTYTATGQKHYVTLRTKQSSRELERMVNALKNDVENRKLVVDTGSTFLDYAREYYKTYKAGRANNTKEMYSNVVEKHFRALEGVKLSDLSRSHYQMLINNASGHPRTQQQIRMVFRQVLESAVADRMLPAGFQDDFFRGLDPVKYRSPAKRPLTANEKKAVFDADLEGQDQALIYIIYGCGLRRQEVLALTVFDVDLHRKDISVNKAHEFNSLTGYKAAVKDTKSANGARVVPIPDKIYPTIEKYVQGCRAAGKVYLFTMRGGEPCSKSSYDRMWSRILRELNRVADEPIEGLTAHIFRHNYCTELCYQIPKVSIKKIAELLGDTEKMVIEVYNHVLQEKEDAVGAVNDALNF